jgi:scyllo-inositol 2-dehydrogenase (NADP+)
MAREDGIIRVGLIGYGLAGASFHALLIDAVDGLRLSAIVTSDPMRADAARRRHEGVTIVRTAEALFARADELDVVVVAAPNRVHGDLARAAIEAGLDVVVDKPLCTTSAEARELVDLAQARGRMLTVFQNRRWDSDALTLASLVESGQLGEIHRFESRFERWRPTVGEGWRELGDPAEGGGILLDLGAHLIDQALHLFGPAQLEHAEIGMVRAGAATDDDVFLALRHAGTGVRSHLWMSAAAAQPGPRMRVLGSRSAWTSWGMDPQEAKLRSGAPAGGPGWGEVQRSEWGMVGVVSADANGMHPLEPQPGDYARFYEGVAHSVRSGTAPPVDPLDAVRALELMEAARTRVSG